MGVWHFLLTVTGTNNEAGYWYGFWSGFGADLTEFAVLALVWRKVNCHAKGCYRVGLHKVEGTPYITCKNHHPVHPGNDSVSAEQIAQAHTDHRARIEAAAAAAATSAAAADANTDRDDGL